METFEEYYKDQLDWSNPTFPTANKHSIMAHLKKEIIELEKDDTGEEFADCMMLLLHYADKAGWNPVEECRKKLEICKQRKWLPPDADGVCHHVKDKSVYNFLLSSNFPSSHEVKGFNDVFIDTLENGNIKECSISSNLWLKAKTKEFFNTLPFIVLNDFKPDDNSVVFKTAIERRDIEHLRSMDYDIRALIFENLFNTLARDICNDVKNIIKTEGKFDKVELADIKCHLEKKDFYLYYYLEAYIRPINL